MTRQRSRSPEVKSKPLKAEDTRQQISRFRRFTSEDCARCALKIPEESKPELLKKISVIQPRGNVEADPTLQKIYFGGLHELCIEESRRAEARIPEIIMDR
jgi:hypothetical protein